MRALRLAADALMLVGDGEVPPFQGGLVVAADLILRRVIRVDL